MERTTGTATVERTMGTATVTVVVMVIAMMVLKTTQIV